MKKILLLITTTIFISTLSACIGLGKTYQYDIILKKPKTKGNAYRDKDIAIFFTFGEKSVDFRIRNFSKEAIKIIWDEASIIIDGNSQRVMHSGIRYLERDRSQVPTTIPPGAIISDSIIPIDNIYFKTGENGGWKISDLFMIHDYNDETYKELILSQKNKEFQIYLPIKKGNKYLGYTFTFRINDVYEITKNKVEKIY